MDGDKKLLDLLKMYNIIRSWKKGMNDNAMVN